MQVSGYENYLVFEDGMVINSLTGRELKSSKTRDGYLFVGLYKNNKRKLFRISRLVALAYIENPENKPEVNHINRITTDNRVENLDWNTRLENMQNRGIQKNNKLGEKNIRKTKYGTYRFTKIINGKYFSKNFKTLEDAIKFRDNYLTNL